MSDHKRTPNITHPPLSSSGRSGLVPTQVVGGPKSLHSQELELEDCSLVVVEGPHAGVVLPLFKDIIDIGRRSELCDLVLAEDNGVSGLHARIQVEQGEAGNTLICLKDLNSRNGTMLGGHQIREAFLTFGSTFQLGHSVLKLQSNTLDKKSLTIHYFDQTGTLVGKSEQMRRIFSMLNRVSQRNVPVLLTGETGTGKSTIARALHRQSQRQKKPFVSVNCGSLPPSLIESALFGHEKGAFTGADQRHAGYFEQANGGTLFLDEIGELPLELQPKLLDVLERKRIMRLGGSKEIPVDFRLITATHRDLPRAIEDGEFREDLYYRLSVIQVEAPALRERPEDLPLLIDRLLAKLYPDSSFQLTEAALHKLKSYLWPGNVRQLRNVLERTFTFLNGNIADADDIELPSLADGPKARTLTTSPGSPTEPGQFVLNMDQFTEQGMPLKEVLTSFERTVLEQALKKTNWNVPLAAELLEIAQSWLYKRIKKYDLKRD